jgi:hypothetical protein
MKNARAFLLVVAALCTPACTASVRTVPLAPAGVRVRPAIARGFAAFETRLATYGRWAPDLDYGVHWCPSADAVGGSASFRPYVTRGHWEVSDAPIGKAPAGSPVWESDDSDTWGEITTHHGWWIHVSPTRGGPWCWVPGIDETPASVVWREGDGFVGWAPEPPDWSAVSDEVDYEDVVDWAFTLLGTLLQDRPDQNTLSGDAEKQARSATAPERAKDGSFAKRQVGPTGKSIQEARSVLNAYVLRHPDVIAAAMTKPGAKNEKHESTSSKESSKSSSSKKKDDASLTVGYAPMPYAMTYYDAFLMQPPMAARGVVPQVAAAGSGSSTAIPGTAPAAIAAGGGIHAHSAAALRSPPSVTSTSATAHASSPASYSYSYSPSHTSSSSSGSSSHSHSHSSRSHSSHRR